MPLLQYTTQRCSDELFTYLNHANTRRFYNVLGDPRYPWLEWWTDILTGVNFGVTPHADLIAGVSQEPVVDRFAWHFVTAARRLLFCDTRWTADQWGHWQFLTRGRGVFGDDGESEHVWSQTLNEFRLPTWLVVAQPASATPTGRCFRVGIAVWFGGEGDDFIAPSATGLLPAVMDAASHVRRGWQSAARPWFSIYPWYPGEAPLPRVTGSSFAASFAAAARLFSCASSFGTGRLSTLLAAWNDTVISADVHEDGNTLARAGELDGKFRALTANDSVSPHPTTVIVSADSGIPSRESRHHFVVLPIRTLDSVLKWFSGEAVPATTDVCGQRRLVRQVIQRTRHRLMSTYPTGTALTVEPVRRARLQRKSMDEIADGGPGILIQGEMGMGKSVLLQDLVQANCEQALHDERHVGFQPDLPFFFVARDFTLPPAALIAPHLDTTATQLPERLAELRAQNVFRRLLIFIDGLNEVHFDGRIADALEELHASLVDGDEWVRVIATCRPARAATWQARGHFFSSVVDVGPFDDDELQECFEQLRAGTGVRFGLDALPPVTREALRTPLMHTLFHRSYQGCAIDALPVQPPLAIPLQFCRAFIERLKRQAPDLFRQFKRWTGLLVARGVTAIARHSIDDFDNIEAFDQLRANGFLVPAEAANSFEELMQLLHPGITAYMIYYFKFVAPEKRNADDIAAAVERNPTVYLEASGYAIQSWIETRQWSELVEFLCRREADLARYLGILTPYLENLDTTQFWSQLARVYEAVSRDARLEFDLWERLMLRGKGAREGRTAFWETVLQRSREPQDRLRCLSLLCRSGLLPDTSYSSPYVEELDRQLQRPELPLAYRIVGRYVMADAVSSRPRGTTQWSADALLAQVEIDLSNATPDDWRTVLPSRVHGVDFLRRYASYVRAYYHETAGKVARRTHGGDSSTDRHYRHALKLFTESCRLPGLRSIALSGMSRVAHNQMTHCHYRGHYDRAMAAADERFGLALRNHNLDDCATSLNNFANLLNTLGLYDMAHRANCLAARLNLQARNYRGVVLSAIHGMHTAILRGDSAESGYAFEQWDAHVHHIVFDQMPRPWPDLETFREHALYESLSWGTMTWLYSLSADIDLDTFADAEWRMVYGNYSVADLIRAPKTVRDAVLAGPIPTESFQSHLIYLTACIAAHDDGASPQCLCRLREVIYGFYPGTAGRCLHTAQLAGITGLDFLATIRDELALPSATPLRHYRWHTAQLLDQIDLAWPEK